MVRSTRIPILLCVALSFACASPAPPARAPRPSAQSVQSVDRADVVRIARSMIGKPYRFGGDTPNGFDCSGLVTYSYGRAGFPGLPHSADGLARMASTVDAADVAPGDLHFFRLGGSKPSHVGIYVGGGTFVHAPSSGKRVEQVSLDHVYWGRQPRSAGRLLR